MGVEACGVGVVFFYSGFELGGGEVEELFEIFAEVGLIGVARFILGGEGGEAAGVEAGGDESGDAAGV